MSTVISVENLGKKYTISHQKSGDNSSLREVITSGVTNFGKKLITPFRSSLAPCSLPSAPATEDFWALEDVSFDVKQGDRIGIIGRNGAGKSTLLKILSRITEPTTGSIRIKGRVASLLEVGTGFHPELTGRENIYLNGAILGMGRQEISRKFDEIVAFAEIEKFLDTPVKRYSSGMYVRLAFAVAAHLEPEILIVDEVLAVGDAQFQKKCLGKMEDVSVRDGRTVLFVSHNMAAVEALCSSTIILNGGKLCSIGEPKEIIRQYLDYRVPVGNSEEIRYAHREGIRSVAIYSVTTCSESVALGDALDIFISYRQCGPVSKQITECGISIWNAYDMRLISISSLLRDQISDYPRDGKIRCSIPHLPLVAGMYFVNAFISSSDGIEDYMTHVQQFTVNDINYFGSGKVVDPQWGAIVVDHAWSIE